MLTTGGGGTAGAFGAATGGIAGIEVGGGAGMGGGVELPRWAGTGGGTASFGNCPPSCSSDSKVGSAAGGGGQTLPGSVVRGWTATGNPWARSRFSAVARGQIAIGTGREGQVTPFGKVAT